jgi:tetratricopeptide (TPR) repeat protein
MPKERGRMSVMSRLRTWLRLWRGSRDYRLLLAGMPALLVGGAALTLITAAAAVPRQEAEERYLDEARRAAKAKDYPAAMTCYDRLAYRGQERPDVLYGMAMTAEAMGQQGRTMTILSGLATTERPGYPPAHLWWARYYMFQPNASAEAYRLAEIHLRFALEGELEDPDMAHGMLGEIYRVTSRLEQAETHLAKAVRSRPQLRLRLAEVHALRGDQQAARREAGYAVSYFRARARADLKDAQSRLTWADAVTFLEEFQEAVAILEEGLALEADGPARSAYRGALGMVFSTWLDYLDRQKEASTETKFRLLDQGLGHDPSNSKLLERLVNWTRQEGPDAVAARASLQALLARGEASATVHLALGVDAWQRGDRAAALVHLEAAHRLAPQMPVVANNLAWVVAHGPQPDLPRALQLVNVALERAPNEPSFRGTRGYILVRMEKWKDALPDLEAALSKDPKSTSLHQDLAETYDRLGVPAMAAEHRRLAQEAPPKR